MRRANARLCSRCFFFLLFSIGGARLETNEIRVCGRARARARRPAISRSQAARCADGERLQSANSEKKKRARRSAACSWARARTYKLNIRAGDDMADRLMGDRAGERAAQRGDCYQKMHENMRTARVSGFARCPSTRSLACWRLLDKQRRRRSGGESLEKRRSTNADDQRRRRRRRRRRRWSRLCVRRRVLLASSLASSLALFLTRRSSPALGGDGPQHDRWLCEIANEATGDDSSRARACRAAASPPSFLALRPGELLRAASRRAC